MHGARRKEAADEMGFEHIIINQMNNRIRNKIFQQWNKDSQDTYRRQGIGRVIKALNGFCIYLCPGNGYEYHQCINGKIVKIRRS